MLVSSSLTTTIVWFDAELLVIPSFFLTLSKSGTGKINAKTHALQK